MTSQRPSAQTIQALIAHLRDSFDGLVVKHSDFSSGAFSLDVRLGGRSWQLDYIASDDCYGIDEIGEDDAFTLGYRHVETTFDAASQVLMGLLREAVAEEKR